MKKLVFLTLSALTLLPVSVLAITDQPTPAPEPNSLILITTGLLGVLGLRRIFKK